MTDNSLNGYLSCSDFPLPTENEEAMASRPNFWPDPMEGFPERRVKKDMENDPELPIRITQAIDWLLERAKSESGEGHQRALRRLIHISHATPMSEEQQKPWASCFGRKLERKVCPTQPIFILLATCTCRHPIELMQF